MCEGGFVFYTDYCKIPTPAEIKAHKLGFHIGDEVWHKEKNIKYKIEEIFFAAAGNLLFDMVEGRRFHPYEIAKTPPKQPIFQMLGDAVVKIELEPHPFDKDSKDDVIIKARGESVTKDEWVEFYNKLNWLITNEIKRFLLKLGKYDVKLVPVEFGEIYKFSIGCDKGIKDVTLDQIEAITKALEKS